MSFARSTFLTLEEEWYVREHPFNIRCIRVRRALDEVERLYQLMTSAQAELDNALVEMNSFAARQKQVVTAEKPRRIRVPKNG